MRVHIGLGSNVGDRMRNLADALSSIDALEGVALLGVSKAVESRAWPDPSDPPYANAVALLETGIAPDALLEELLAIEAAMGRDHGASRNSPRVIDLDILLAETDEWVREDLRVPHPRMAEREFVIIPLLELDPGVEWPDGSPVTAERVTVGEVIATLGPVPGFEDRTPATRPVSGEEWVPVFEHAMPKARFMTPPSFTHVPMHPDAVAPLVEMVLAQEGIPAAWDPFDPRQASDPYGLPRQFKLMVPSSMANAARELIQAALAAPFDGSELADPSDAGDGQGSE